MDDVRAAGGDAIADEVVDDGLGHAGPADRPIGDVLDPDAMRRLGVEVQMPHLIAVDQPGAHAVFEIVAIVGDAVGHVRHLAFERAVELGFELRPRIEVRGDMIAGLRICANPQSAHIRNPILSRAFSFRRSNGLAGQAQPRLVHQVQAHELRIRVLQQSHDPQSLGVVLETAAVGHQFVEHVLARVAEGRMAQVVGQADRLRQAFVETEHFGDGPADLGNLDRVRETRAIVVVDAGREDLGLALQPPERRAVDNPIAVPLEIGAVRVRRLGENSPLAHRLRNGIRTKSIRHNKI